MNQKTFYFGYGTMHAPKEYVDTFSSSACAQIERFTGLKRLEFPGRGTVSAAEEVIEFKDIELISADYAFFVLDYPSLTIGIEALLRQEERKPSLFFAQNPDRVSRMMRGFISQNDLLLCRYTSPTHIGSIARDWIKGDLK